ncbi:MAG TPA: YdcF family protein [Pyrinomonadaceae bacterium]|nr:YdcF family protein [Pyrinomonadaceae bacterium]
MRQEIRELARRLWDYHHMNHALERSEVVFVLCSHDTAVAERGARLYLEGWAPLLVFSGGSGVITKSLWSEPEAELFARIARGMGVPDERLLVETRSTNTGENVRFTRELLAGRGLSPQSLILVQKPYMERRTFATFKNYWPGPSVVVTSPQVSFEEYLEGYSNSALTEDDVVGIMVGDLQRLRVYPERGFQIPQEIPADVWAAYEELVRAGYDKYLI